MTRASSFQLPNRARRTAAVVLALGVCAAIYGVIAQPAALMAKPAAERLLCGFARSLVHVFPCRATGHRGAMVSQSAQNSGSLHASCLRCLGPDRCRSSLAAMFSIRGAGREPWPANRRLRARLRTCSRSGFLRAWSLFSRHGCSSPGCSATSPSSKIMHPELALALHQKLTRYAVMFVPVFAVTLTLGGF